MKADPMINDWSQLVSGDFQLINLNITDNQKFRDAAYMEFKEQQAGHEKGRLLEHENLSKPKTTSTSTSI